MSLAAPGFLWGLLVLIPLVAIFFLKVKPRKKETNAFFLWQKIFEEKKASSLFRKLRDLLSLLLLALAASAIVFAMTRPQVEGDDGRDLLIVIDNSASMMAGQRAEKGIEQAREEARELILAMNGTRKAALATLSDKLEFRSHLSDSPKDLLKALRLIEARPVSVSEDARGLLNRYVNSEGSEHRVILLSDGHGGLDGLDENVEVIRVGEKRKNVGLIAADLKWIPGSGKTAEFFYQTASSYDKAVQGELELRSRDGEIGTLVSLDLKPGKSEPAVIRLNDIEAGDWVAELHVADDFATDNTADLILEAKRKLPVRVSAGDRYFFERCVESFEHSGGMIRLVPGAGAELVVSSGAPDGEEAALVFAPHGESPYWESLGDEVGVLAAKPLVEKHPLLRHLDLEGISFAGARQLKAPQGSLVLVESENGLPLIYKITQNGRNVLVANLDPAAGDFFLSPWFPVMVYDAALHLASRETQWQGVYATGSTVSLPKDATLKTPGGSEVKSGSVSLDEVGRYELTKKNGEVKFGAALLNEGESMLDGSGPETTAKELSSGHPFSFWLLLLALLIIVGESAMYHRRKVG